MSDNKSDDKVDDDFGLDDDFEDFGEDFDSGDKSALSQKLKDPKAKVGIILGAAALIFGAMILLGGNDEEAGPSFVAGGTEVTTPPGTEEAPQAYVEAIEETNQAEYERAILEGDSAIPVPISTAKGAIDLGSGDEDEEDPLQRWRRLQNERLEQELEQVDVLPPPVDQTARGQALQELANLMSQQMQSILDQTSTPTQLGFKAILTEEFLEQQAQAGAQSNLFAANQGFFENGTGPGFGNGAISGSQAEEVTVLIPAGKIEYAQLITEANSDVPGPVLAELMSGPLRGSRVLGSFQVESDYLTLQFDTIVVDGVSQSINAAGLDPETTLPGVATEVDYRLLQRIILPMAASFVEGAANAIAQSGLTTVTINGETVAQEEEETDQDQEIASGVEEAGAELREILDNQADNIETLVKIHAGTPVGILFLQPVTDESTTIIQPQIQQQTQAQTGTSTQ